jgi:hypothetical protein
MKISFWNLNQCIKTNPIIQFTGQNRGPVNLTLLVIDRRLTEIYTLLENTPFNHFFTPEREWKVKSWKTKTKDPPKKNIENWYLTV